MLFQLALVGALAASPPPHSTRDTTLALLAPPIFRSAPVAPLTTLPTTALRRKASSLVAIERTARPVFGQPLTRPVVLAPDPVRNLFEPDPDPQLIEYSDGYFTRLTIHKWASYLMLPLFVSDFIVGQKLINGNGSDNLRNVHGALAGGIAGLFAVNTVTGGMNMIEGWHDPYGRTRRTIHSALMILADIGFVVTAALANENENEGGSFSPSVSNTTHRTVAIASMSTALLGYSIMLPIFGSD
jgi:hypothetical protein